MSQLYNVRKREELLMKEIKKLWKS